MMKFTVERERLTATLGRVMGAVDKRSTLPILTHVLMTVYLRGAVGFLATDLEVAAAAECAADVPRAGGEVCVCAEKFKAALAAIDADEVKVERFGDEIKVSGGLFEFVLPVLPPDEFPRVDADHTFYADVQAGILTRLIKAVSHAAAKGDINKAHLAGVHLDGDMASDRLQAVGTDGHRLSLAAVSFDNVGELGKPFTLSTKGCNLAAWLPGSLELRRSSSSVAFSHSESRVVARLAEGEFPRYRRVIPASMPSHLVANREAMVAAVEAALVMAEGEGRSVLLTWSSGDRLQVSALGPVGSCVADVPCQSDSEMGLSIRVNSRYLIQALESLEGEEVFVKWGGDRDPLLLTPVDLGCFDERLEVVMPMRV